MVKNEETPSRQTKWFSGKNLVLHSHLFQAGIENRRTTPSIGGVKKKAFALHHHTQSRLIHHLTGVLLQKLNQEHDLKAPLNTLKQGVR